MSGQIDVREAVCAIIAQNGDVEGLVSTMRSGDLRAAARAWSGSPAVRSGAFPPIDTDAEEDEIAKGFRQRMRIARISAKGNPARIADFVEAMSAAVRAAGTGRPAVAAAPADPAPRTREEPPAPVPERGAAPRRAPEITDLLVGPRPPIENRVGMMNWLTAQPWAPVGIGMEYPENVFDNDDAIRIQSLFSSDPEGFVSKIRVAGGEAREEWAADDASADLTEAFPAMADARVTAMAKAALMAAIARIDPAQAAIIDAAHGTPMLTPAAAKLSASVIAALESMRPLPGFPEDMNAEGAEIPLGDFGPQDRVSAAAVLGHMMFGHLCGKSLPEAASSTLASVLVRVAYPDQEDVAGIEAWELGNAFRDDPAGSVRRAVSEVESSPEIV